MDPNACRQSMIANANLVLSILNTASETPHTEYYEKMERAGIDLAEAVHDMDVWLRMGGFFPDLWVRQEGQIGRKQDA